MMARDRLSGKVQFQDYLFVQLFIFMVERYIPTAKIYVCRFFCLRHCSCCLDATLKVLSKWSTEESGVLPDCRHTEKRCEKPASVHMPDVLYLKEQEHNVLRWVS